MHLIAKRGQNNVKEVKNMSGTNKTLVPGAKDYLSKMKYETAGEVGVTLKQGYNGDISAKDAGRVGGNMVKKMIKSVENNFGAK